MNCSADDAAGIALRHGLRPVAVADDLRVGGERGWRSCRR